MSRLYNGSIWLTNDTVSVMRDKVEFIIGCKEVL